MRRRMWIVAVVDCEVMKDAMGRHYEQPIGEPTVLASTCSPVVAERAIAQLAHDAAKGPGGMSMVRGGVEALPPAVADALDEEPSAERILSLVEGC